MPVAISALSWLVLRGFPQASLRCQQLPTEQLAEPPEDGLSLYLLHLAPAQPIPVWLVRLKGGVRRRLVVFVEKADYQAVRVVRLALRCTILDASTETLLSLCARVRRAVGGRTYISPSIRLAAAQKLPDPELFLTAAEHRVLEVIGTGADDVQASMLLGIQPATVMTHRSHVMRKLGVRHRGELIRAAIRYGYVSIGANGDLSPTRSVRPRETSATTFPFARVEAECGY